MEDVFFSVIVPVFNSQEYLQEAVESVLNQTYSRFEIVLVDDGSTDLSAGICDKLSQENANISVFHQKNRGQLYSRIAGIGYSKGDYLVFLDSDDRLKKDALAVLNISIKQYNCDCVIYGMDRFFESGSVVPFAFDFEKETVINDKRELYLRLFCGEKYNSLCIKAVKKSVFHDFDYSDYIGKVAHGEDRLQTVEIAKNSNAVLFLDSSLYEYRMNQQSLTHKEFDSAFKKDYTVSKYVYDFLKSENVFSEYDFSHYFGDYICDVIKWIKLISKSNNSISDRVIGIRSYQNDDFYKTIIESKPDVKCLSLTGKILYILFRLKMFRTIILICNLK